MMKKHQKLEKITKKIKIIENFVEKFQKNIKKR